MADAKISALPELSETPNDNDYLPIVDVSDTSESVTGKTKKVKKSYLGHGLPSSGTTGQLLSKASNTDYDTTWTNAPAGNLSGLTDTTITSPSDGQVLTYNNTSSKWVNAAASGGGGGGGSWTLIENLSAVGATTWTFASTLDLNTDRLYKVEVYLDYDNGSSEIGQLHIRPNGTTTDMTYTTNVFDSTTGSVSNSKAESTTYGRSIWTNSTIIQATFYIAPMNGGKGAIYSYDGIGVSSPVVRRYTGGGAWKSTTTNMTSLNFWTNTANNAVIGSLKLYKIVTA